MVLQPLGTGVRAAAWSIAEQHQGGSLAGQAESDTSSTRGSDRKPQNDTRTDKKKGKQGKKKDKQKPKQGSKHPSLTIGRALTLEITGRVEGDVRGATPAMGLERSQVDWQDRRIGIKGTAFSRIDFEVSRELGEDFEQSIGASTKTAWRDVAADAHFAKALNVEVGQFKLPFGHDELTGETDLDFAYRSLAARVLSPGRDPGVMVHGRLFGRGLEYQAGYFTRDGMNARTSQTEGGKDARAARVVVQPFKAVGAPALAPLELGAAIADSRFDTQLGIRGRTVLGDGVFFDRVYVNGRQRRIGLDAAWAAGPVGLSAEYVGLTAERNGMGFDGEDLPGVHAGAWYAAGTVALTGERKRGRLEPRREFPGHGPGAVEIAVRLETLRFDAVAYPSSGFEFLDLSNLRGNADRVATFGVNWYLNRYLKVQADVIREAIADPQRSPAPSRGGRFISSVLRLQFRL
jgi:phosphate-selective porin OprO/OprP